MLIGDVEEDQQHSGMTPAAETRRVPASWTELAYILILCCHMAQ